MIYDKDEFFVTSAVSSINEGRLVEDASEDSSSENESTQDQGAFKKTSTNKLESTQFLKTVDLICEGPIEGLVDKEGNSLKYLGAEEVSDLVLAKGIYYNDVALLDSNTNKFNYVTSNFKIDYGEEFSSFGDFPSTIFNYKKQMFLNENDYELQIARLGVNNEFFSIKKDGGIASLFGAGTPRLFNAIVTQSSAAGVQEQTLVSEILSQIERAKGDCTPFNHKIKNKYCDSLKVQIAIESLYSITKNGSTAPSHLEFVVQLSETASANAVYTYVAINGVSKGGIYVVNIPFELNLVNDGLKEYIVSVFPLTAKIPPTTADVSKNFSVHSIIEQVKTKGVFSYPFSSKVSAVVSSDHFQSDPDRTFDLKLKKINIPVNYDPEAREYSGVWDGTFAPFLKWTDNPAWIFYDICVNSRYGLGNGAINEKDLNKWDLYKISTYCDTLVKTFAPQKYKEDTFYTAQFAGQDLKAVYIDKAESGLNLRDAKVKYCPVYEGSAFYSKNGGAQNSIIYLYDLYSEADGRVFSNNFKKIVWNVREGEIKEGKFTVTAEGQGSVFRLDLGNDFGAKSKIESYPNDDLLNKVKEDIIVEDDPEKDLSVRLAASCKNSEEKAKQSVILFYSENYTDQIQIEHIVNYFSEDIFPSDYRPKDPSTNRIPVLLGRCVPKCINYPDALESRFTANVYIDNSVECLKILNDLASIFRGMAYYKNNFITSTVDVDKNPVYTFNNTNVKDGLFTYASGSLDGNYSVAKVLYKDKNNVFEDAVEIVEDSELIKEYGIVVKEILGFGITSKGQARRAGEWMLATNRFENETVAFITDIQGLILSPSDVIEIKDQQNSSSTIQGRVVSVNYDDCYIIVDRKIDVNLINSEINFIVDSTVVNPSKTVSSDGIFNANPNFQSFTIQSIENNTNKIYLHKTNNIDYLPAVAAGTPFTINAVRSNESTQNLYKIVSIAEEDANQYSFFCIKHSPNKYSSIDNKVFDAREENIDGPVSFSSYSTIKELDTSETSGIVSFYNIETFKSTQVLQSNYDAFFSESDTTFDLQNENSFGLLVIKFDELRTQIQNLSSSSAYYSTVNDILNNGGGFICRILYKNQSVKIKIPNSDVSAKRVLLGRVSNTVVENAESSFLNLKLFIYNNKDQIVEV